MKTLIFVVLVLAVASTSSAAVIIGGLLYNHPDNPGWCTITPDIVVDPGRHADTRPGIPCGLILCYNDGSVEFHTCSIKEMFSVGFKYDGYLDLNREYPECCELKISRTRAQK